MKDIQIKADANSGAAAHVKTIVKTEAKTSAAAPEAASAVT